MTIVNTAGVNTAGVRTDIVDTANTVCVNNDVETNERGGRQSRLSARYDLIDPHALHALAAVLHRGAQVYGEANWRLIEVNSHLNHAIAHIYGYLAGGAQEDLAHAFARLMMAVALDWEERGKDACPYKL